MIFLCGIPVVTSDACVEQFRFPRSKKKRIRRKWAKRSENFRPHPRLFQFQGGYYGHPATVARFAASLKKQAEAHGDQAVLRAMHPGVC